MPRHNSHVPAYRLHKPSGQARVIINREHIYLGKFGSPESREQYARLIAQISSNGGDRPAKRSTLLDKPGLSINALILAHWQFAKSRYLKNGKPTITLDSIRAALRPLRQLYGSTPAADFGPN